MALRFSQLTPATQLNDADIFAITQNFNSKSITADLTAKYTMRDSSYADVIETITSNKDYLSSELEPDHRIFADSISSDITLGFFNGADRDGTKITIINTNVNVVFIELVSDGVTNYILNTNETIEIIWDDINSKWKVILKQLNGIYDIIINSQEDFNSIIERVAANQYKIKDSIKSVYFEFLSGGYQMSGVDSPLSGGDTWGYIQTNNCAIITFALNTSIDFDITQGYIEVNTAFCFLYNVKITGNVASTSDIKRSFLLDATFVTFLNCSVYGRYSNSATNFIAFEGSVDSYKNESSQYIGCVVYSDFNGTGTFSAFYNCQNIINSNIRNMSNINNAGSIVLYENCINVNNSHIYEINSVGNGFLSICKNSKDISNMNIRNIDFVTAGAGSIVLFDTCTNISNGIITDIDADDDTYIFKDCDNINNINMDDIDISAGILTIFTSSELVNNIKITNITSNGDLKIFYTTNKVLNVDVFTADSGNDIYGANGGSHYSNVVFNTLSATNNVYGFNTIFEMTNCTSLFLSSTSGTIYSFYGCKGMSTCTTGSITTTRLIYGFYQCDWMSSCFVQDIHTTGDFSIFGFHQCKNISSSDAEIISTTSTAASIAAGFSSCENVSACKSNNITNTGIGNAYSFTSNINITGCTGDIADIIFNSCTEISDCTGTNAVINVFSGNHQISACTAKDSNEGFNSCTEMSGCKAIDNTNDGYFQCRGVAANSSFNNGGYGFNDCRRMGFNRSNGNTTGQYNNCYADTVGIDIVADAAVGGYNTTA